MYIKEILVENISITRKKMEDFYEKNLEQAGTLA